MAISEENIRLIFGLKLKQLRDEKSMSLSDLSEVSGVSISYLNEIEKGKKYPKSDKIISLANALGSSYDQLVSLKLSRNLAPINELLNSDIIQELPFDTFGIDKSKLFDMIANAPSRVTAFISTLLEIARNYNMKQEHFYFASLRSFQEMYDNYFDDIEKSVKKFCSEEEFSNKPAVDAVALKKILTEKYKYRVEESEFEEFPALENFRSVYIAGKTPTLLVNKRLTKQQKNFLFAKEIGFQYLKYEVRPFTSSWLKVRSFEEVLNNFYASYFAGALLINSDDLIVELDKFFAAKKWNGKSFLEIVKKFDVSAEMFLHRLSSILPKNYGVHQLFFIRYNSTITDEDINQPTKELHLSRMSNPFNKNRSEHLYRRWVTRKLLRFMVKQKKEVKENYIEAIRSRYDRGGNDYFCISVLRADKPISHSEDSVTLGFVISEAIKKKIKFLDDDKIFFQDVESSFEDEMAPEGELIAQSIMDEREQAVKSLVKRYRS
ncbi:MAG: ImmA/IrrE family metallo-endopeptidase [Bacteroidia bacterium]|nr:ImmA/IrrE family metallo-endopeptidase [Bacteroidia bacterium]